MSKAVFNTVPLPCSICPCELCVLRALCLFMALNRGGNLLEGLELLEFAVLDDLRGGVRGELGHPLNVALIPTHVSSALGIACLTVDSSRWAEYLVRRGHLPQADGVD